MIETEQQPIETSDGCIPLGATKHQFLSGVADEQALLILSPNDQGTIFLFLLLLFTSHRLSVAKRPPKTN